MQTRAPTMKAAARLLTRGFRGRFGQVPHAPSPDASARLSGGLRMLRWDAPGGPPLVLLHGLNSNAWVWARMAGELRRPVYALFLPGHADSAPPRTDLSLGGVLAQVVDALDELHIDLFDLGGHSWGGKLATVLAALHPDRVRRLVLADPVLPQGLGPVVSTLPSLLRSAFAHERSTYSDLAALDAGADEVLYLGVGGGLDDADRQLWHACFHPGPDGRLQPALSSAHFDEIVQHALPEDTRPLLNRIQAPTLLLRPTLTVSFWPGALRPMRGLPDFHTRGIWGDHTFIHSNPLDAASMFEEFLG